jgi:hypothetical protein
MCREENAQAARAFRGSAMPACRDAQRSAAMRENFRAAKKSSWNNNSSNNNSWNKNSWNNNERNGGANSCVAPDFE